MNVRTEVMTAPVEEFVLGSKTARSNNDLVMTYRNNILTFGFSARTLLYSADSLHEAKLKQYQKILPKFIEPGDSLLDIGCGYGSLAQWLNENPVEYKYHGIDIVPEFVAEARSKYSKENITFETVALEDYQGYSDWCVLLGVVSSVPDPVRLVQLAWEKCRKGLIVDFNDIHYKPHSNYNEFDIEAQKELLLQLEAKIVLEDDGADLIEKGYGWTILVATKR
jgi:2-polyprenyl-3-methyl-5-hydroxy-6-metoxy-1,4-benzoquinol methylase